MLSREAGESWCVWVVVGLGECCFYGRDRVDPPLVTEKNKFDQPIHGGTVRDED